jgi:hypothetical protein
MTSRKRVTERSPLQALGQGFVQGDRTVREVNFVDLRALCNARAADQQVLERSHDLQRRESRRIGTETGTQSLLMGIRGFRGQRSDKLGSISPFESRSMDAF